MDRRNVGLNAEEADGVAIAALGFMARDPSRLDRFLALTGLTPDSIREAAADPGFLASVLDYMMNDEALLLEFCETEGMVADHVPAAHAALSRLQT
ncbi:MAG: DUF3572 domain-containing protein [Pseudomonadota bacterium]